MHSGVVCDAVREVASMLSSWVTVLFVCLISGYKKWCARWSFVVVHRLCSGVWWCVDPVGANLPRLCGVVSLLFSRLSC